MEEIITIEVMGKPFNFRAWNEGAVDPNEIARYLSDAVRQVEGNFPEYTRKINKTAIILLAALNITKDYLILRDCHSNFMKSVSTRSFRLNEKVNDCILNPTAE